MDAFVKRVETHVSLQRLAAAPVIAEAHENVVDSAVGLVKERGEGVAAGEGDPRALPRNAEGVREVGALAAERGEAAEESDLIGVGVGVEVAGEDRG